MEKIISFIIPAFNAQQYLKKCLDSFLNTKILDKLEVIIINDGSFDETRSIAAAYVDLHPDSYRLVNKLNEGHGSAINAGSRTAKGKYFKVIDADDWVITENLAEFVSRLEKCDSDVVVTPFHMIDMKSGCKREQSFRLTSSLMDLEEIIANWFEYERCMVFHGITYRTEFYREYAYQLPKHVFYEDQEFSAIPCCHAKRIAVFNVFVYQYMIGNTGQSIAVENQAKRKGHIEQVLVDMLNYYNKRADLSQAAQEYLRLKIENVVLIYFMAACVYERNREKGKRESQRLNQMIVMKNPLIASRLRRKYKIYILMNRLHISPRLYQWMMRPECYGKIKLIYNKYVRRA